MNNEVSRQIIRVHLDNGYVDEAISDLKEQLQKTQRDLAAVRTTLDDLEISPRQSDKTVEIFKGNEFYIHLRILCFLALVELKGHIFCVECQEIWDPGNLWLESFERTIVYPDVPLGNGGRRLLCRANHLLIDIVDWRT